MELRSGKSHVRSKSGLTVPQGLLKVFFAEFDKFPAVGTSENFLYHLMVDPVPPLERLDMAEDWITDQAEIAHSIQYLMRTNSSSKRSPSGFRTLSSSRTTAFSMDPP